MRSSHTGFTLIEVLVAMTMFSIAFTGMASLMTRTIQTNFLAARISEATTLGRDKIENIRNQGITAATCPAATTTIPPGNFFWNCTSAAGPTAGTTQVTVNTWWTGNDAHPVVMRTIF